MSKGKCVAKSYGKDCPNEATTVCQWGGSTYRVCNGHIRGEVVGKV